MARKTRDSKPELARSPVIEELPVACAQEAAAVEFFERKRWGDAPCCPHCGSQAVYKMTGRDGQRNARFLWRCRDCSKQYTVRVGTIFGESLIPLHKWARAFWEACACKNCISALELSRKLQITHKSALFMMHRIRHAMADDHASPPKMTGTVEADETYVGGKPRHKGHNARGRGTKKQPVASVLQRGGTVRSTVIPAVNGKNLRAVLLANVCTSSRLITDQEGSYVKVGPEFQGGHETVNHRIREYARGDVTTNSVEGFFARVKRGLNGTFHAVSREHLHRYLSGFDFAHNTRGMDDGARTELCIQRGLGKRLAYADYVARAG